MRPLKKSGAKATAMDDNFANGKPNNDGHVQDLEHVKTGASGPGTGNIDALREVRTHDELLRDGGSGDGIPRRENGDRDLQDDNGAGLEGTVSGGGPFKTYKRKYFGLVQLVLLNIIISWDVSATSTQAASIQPRCVG